VDGSHLKVRSEHCDRSSIVEHMFFCDHCGTTRTDMYLHEHVPCLPTVSYHIISINIIYLQHDLELGDEIRIDCKGAVLNLFDPIETANDDKA